MKNFAKELAFYSAYHENRINVWIHIIGVPITAFGFLMAFSLVDFGLMLGSIHFTLATVYVIIVMLYFLFLNIQFTIVATLVYGAMLFLIDHLVFNIFDTKMTIIIAGTTFFGAFAFLFVGHGFFEKKRPTLIDNLVQAFLLAPIFILVDIAFVLGINKQLKKDIESHIAADPSLRALSKKFK